VQNGNVKIVTYIFGSGASHTPKYYLLEVKSNVAVQYKIIDDAALEDAITGLLDFLKHFGLKDSEKAVPIRGLTFVYN
jgi:hypothetical protein